MHANLSIRTYTKRMSSHVHDGYHQLVLPIQGSIHIDMDAFIGNVSVGDCLVIRQGAAHGFNADQASRFIVADMDALPEHLHDDNMVVFSATPPFLSLLIYYSFTSYSHLLLVLQYFCLSFLLPLFFLLQGIRLTSPSSIRFLVYL